MELLGKMGASEEQIELMEVATNFCRDKSPMEKVRELLDDELGYDPAVWTEMVELGWLGIAIPEEFDGVGLGLAEVVPVVEQMGRRMMGGPLMSTTLAAQVVLAGGTDGQKSDLLPKLASGTIATLALTEENSDWDFKSIACTAQSSGSDVALSGTKLFVTDARVADIILVSVEHDGKPAFVILEKADVADGALRRETVIDQTRRSFELTLDGITVPADRLLDADKASAAFAHLHLAGNLLGAAEMTGSTQNVIDYTLEYLKTRKQFGKLIGSYQALKHPIVDAYVDYEKARSHVLSAAFCFNDQGRGEVATRMAKAQADKAFSYAADRAIQFHGGFGFTFDCDAQLYRRRAVWNAMQFGDGAYHKEKLADLLL